MYINTQKTSIQMILYLFLRSGISGPVLMATN